MMMTMMMMMMMMWIYGFALMGLLNLNANVNDIWLKCGVNVGLFYSLYTAVFSTHLIMMLLADIWCSCWWLWMMMMMMMLLPLMTSSLLIWWISIFFFSLFFFLFSLFFSLSYMFCCDVWWPKPPKQTKNINSTQPKHTTHTISRIIIHKILLNLLRRIYNNICPLCRRAQLQNCCSWSHHQRCLLSLLLPTATAKHDTHHTPPWKIVLNLSISLVLTKITDSKARHTRW